LRKSVILWGLGSQGISDKSVTPWFNESCRGLFERHLAVYLGKFGRSAVPPRTWVSMGGCSAITLSSARTFPTTAAMEKEGAGARLSDGALR